MTRRQKAAGLTVAIFTLTATSMFFCAQSAAQERVRMALSVRNVVFLPFYYAKDAKIFEKHGLNVAEKGFRILARSRQLVDSPWLGLVANKNKIDKQPEQVRNMLRSMRDVVAAIRRERQGIISYIAKNFNVSAANAAESYEDISGVIIDSMMMRDELIQKYLDGSHQRGELPKPLAAADMFDFSLLRSLK
jgi:ABC-type nitrate/sulfonate/bicarbonate transport system substrate-binding protein